MHDSAIAAWGIKGWYDYVRPVSAVRGMCDFGQSSDPSLVGSYHPDGIPLEAGLIEVVTADDPLLGGDRRHVDGIKLLAWKGPHFIINPDTDEAGVGWIRAENGGPTNGRPLLLRHLQATFLVIPPSRVLLLSC